MRKIKKYKYRFFFENTDFFGHSVLLSQNNATKKRIKNSTFQGLMSRSQ